MRKVSIIIPVVRPKLAKRCEMAIRQNAGVPADQYEIIKRRDKKLIGCPKMIARMTAMAKHDLVMFLGDDTIPQPGFLKNALAAMETLPGGWGLVGLNDGFHKPVDGNKITLATHWLADKRLLQLTGGHFFFPGYKHTFCDNELTIKANHYKRYMWAEDARLVHANPIVDKAIAWDDHYRRAYNEVWTIHDRELFRERMADFEKQIAARSGEPTGTDRPFVAICVPSAGHPWWQFEQCLHEAQINAFQNSIDTIRLTRIGSMISHSRNQLVNDVLERYPEITHILFVDDDMTFPRDTITRLVRHNKDMVACNAYRKQPPYIPIAAVLDDNNRFQPIHMPPAEGKLLRISVVGTGLVLFKPEVFSIVPFPWFEMVYEKTNQTDFKMYEDCVPQNVIRGKILISEDMRFFMIAQSYGLKLYCDFSIDVGHLTAQTINWKSHEAALQPEFYEKAMP